jgi:arylsulfatase A-like enzyme
MATAAAWLETEAPHADRYFLLIDEFDPHEPFDTPERWATRYDDSIEPRIIWPPYVTDALAEGRVTPEDGRRIRAAYGAKLSMIDHHLGRILDQLDRDGAWGDTAVVLCTDHGHYLGEHDAFGKPGLPLYETMSHIPLLVAWPGAAPRDVDALTTTVDIFATLCDVFGVVPQHRTHGRSLVPLLTGEATAVRDWALMGVWGRQVHVTDGRRKYARAANEENRPLSMWSNRWSTMPVHAFPEFRLLPRPDRRAVLDFMPGSDVPVIRQPYAPGDLVPMWASGTPGHSHVWNVDDDPAEEHDLAGTSVERELEELLRTALDDVDAPHDQLERLGLA